MYLKLLVLTGVVGVVAASAAQGGGKGSREEKLIKVLTAKELWGKEFPAVLVRLPSWQDIGEKKVLVFPDRVVGATPYRKRAEAETRAKKLSAAMKKEPSGKLAPKFAELLRAAAGAPPRAFKPQLISFFADDDSNRVAWMATEAAAAPQFLEKGLTVKQLHKEVGRPEKVTKEVVESERGEPRPVILTLHQYAGGAVVFAESDLSPRPGTVDRVILDVSRVSAAVFTKKE